MPDAVGSLHNRRGVPSGDVVYRGKPPNKQEAGEVMSKDRDDGSDLIKDAQLLLEILRETHHPQKPLSMFFASNSLYTGSYYFVNQYPDPRSPVAAGRLSEIDAINTLKRNDMNVALSLNELLAAEGGDLLDGK